MGCLRKRSSARRSTWTCSSSQASGGFGGIKMTGEALPPCQFQVEPCYEGAGPATTASTRASSTATDRGPEGIRAFDLRNALV